MSYTNEPIVALGVATLQPWETWRLGVSGPPLMPEVLTYSFSTVTAEEAAQGLAEIPLAQRPAIRAAFDAWAAICGISFVEVTWTGVDGPTAIDVVGVPGLGYHFAYMPDPVFGTQIVLDTLAEGGNNAPGTGTFWAILHEIGHALSLKHPFDGVWRLPPALDVMSFTIMSYNQDAAIPTAPAPGDIAAAVYLYGTEASEAADGILWGLDAATQRVFFVSGPGHDRFATSFADDVVDSGAGDDTVFGLRGDDRLSGGAGNDMLYGSYGDDLLIGGPGWDALFGDEQEMTSGLGFLEQGFDTAGFAGVRREHSISPILGGRRVDGPGSYDNAYGIEAFRFADGTVSYDPRGAAGSAYRMYHAALGRAPDEIGLGNWTQALRDGALDVQAMAQGFLGSAEFALRYGSTDNAGFVTLLYANVLGRAPDAPGLANWLSALSSGMSRAAALAGFSESEENILRHAAPFTAGLWTVDPEAVDVLRLYWSALGRLPDAGGLAAWTGAREAGMALTTMAQGFLGSAEFVQRYGALDTEAYVTELYANVLGRAPDPTGLDAWTGAVEAGALDRDQVLLGFAFSDELTNQLQAEVAGGIQLLG